LTRGDLKRSCISFYTDAVLPNILKKINIHNSLYHNELNASFSVVIVLSLRFRRIFRNRQTNREKPPFFSLWINCAYARPPLDPLLGERGRTQAEFGWSLPGEALWPTRSLRSMPATGLPPARTAPSPLSRASPCRVGGRRGPISQDFVCGWLGGWVSPCRVGGWREMQALKTQGSHVRLGA
jgi:hypothetical protein